MPRFRSNAPDNNTGLARLRADLLAAQNAYQSRAKPGAQTRPSDPPFLHPAPLVKVQTIQDSPQSIHSEPALLKELLLSLQSIRVAVETQGAYLQHLITSRVID